jgi:hypothetical protein
LLTCDSLFFSCAVHIVVVGQHARAAVVVAVALLACAAEGDRASLGGRIVLSMVLRRWNCHVLNNHSVKQQADDNCYAMSFALLCQSPTLSNISISSTTTTTTSASTSFCPLTREQFRTLIVALCDAVADCKSKYNRIEFGKFGSVLTTIKKRLFAFDITARAVIDDNAADQPSPSTSPSTPISVDIVRVDRSLVNALIRSAPSLQRLAVNLA